MAGEVIIRHAGPSGRSWLARVQYWIYSSWFLMMVKYRKTLLGPLWLMVGPAVLVFALGQLYATINSVNLAYFVPFLTVGIIVWSLMIALIDGGTNVFFHNRDKIIHSGTPLLDVIMTNIFTAMLKLIHHLVILVVVYIIYRWGLSLYVFVSVLGVLILMYNGIWWAIVMGILGVRFRDVSEIVTAIMGAMFFLTPILWTPDAPGRGGMLGPYLTYNPLYHFLEIIRAPIMGEPIDALSWMVVGTITVVGTVIAWLFHRRFAHLLPTWF